MVVDIGEIILKNKEEKTNAIRLLEQKKLNFKVHDYSQSDVISGLDVANYLKENPDRVFKTLVTIGKSGSHYVFLVPVNKELNLKKAAQSVSEKNISMIKSKELLPLTGYIHGGCSPIGMKKFFTTIIDASAKDFDEIIFSAGKIGFQIEMNLTDLEKIIKFKFDEITI
jgi:Cys-tRNA(Pro)/Cys-tRNA(Cys) deacylase